MEKLYTFWKKTIVLLCIIAVSAFIWFAMHQLVVITRDAPETMNMLRAFNGWGLGVILSLLVVIVVFFYKPKEAFALPRVVALTLLPITDFISIVTATHHAKYILVIDYIFAVVYTLAAAVVVVLGAITLYKKLVKDNDEDIA
ncbi:hypothetical protein [Companilactobacillus ginsenosidimutans]|uniref:Uncharacterized protein n=1 Tax=Companilactobacillus ginsenosidimutans TaxID=1007676 RepID=A0A0H4R0X8_9LACO|nr:hypothetical protein [Companilactobacillus ginsenosidimutans]AKP67380.1 hypothetical protein ABM34_07405 [Companilactobacillus ginsenosidimutans]